MNIKSSRKMSDDRAMARMEDNSVDMVLTSPPYEDIAGAGYKAQKKDGEMTPMKTLWAAFWYSKNRPDGVTEHIIYGDDCLPILFKTRKACRGYIKERYGYIKNRHDLRSEPHGWRLPRPVLIFNYPCTLTGERLKKCKERQINRSGPFQNIHALAFQP